MTQPILPDQPVKIAYRALPRRMVAADVGLGRVLGLLLSSHHLLVHLPDRLCQDAATSASCTRMGDRRMTDFYQLLNGETP